MDAFICPRCGGRAVGRVGLMQWYCWDCCVEFARNARGVEIFAMDEEGELLPVAQDDGGGGEVSPCDGSVAAS